MSELFDPDGKKAPSILAAPGTLAAPGLQAAPVRTLVMKFGGTSVATPQAMVQAARIVQQARAEWSRLVVVTSALAGVTDLLLTSAACAAKGDLQTLYTMEGKLRAAHDGIVNALVSDPARGAQVRQEISSLVTSFIELCRAISVLGEATPRALDAVASLGERMCVRLLAAVLESLDVPAQYVEATQIIVTDARFQNAHPDLAATSGRASLVLEPILARGLVPVVTGFIGATPEGITTTLGRGGSDYSAGILGAALPADDVWIWTDVDGIMSADPRLVPEAYTIQEMTYREIAELAYFGAKVLHPKTIRPVIEAGIGLRICNTFNPGHPGTRLVSEQAVNGRGSIKAVTAVQKQRLVTVEGRGMLGVPGVAARTFAAVASTNTSVPLIIQASSEQSICFAVPSDQVQEVIHALQVAFTNELANKDIDRVWASDEAVIITVVGAGMCKKPENAGRIFSALGEQGVPVMAIAQGSSEMSISLMVSAGDSERAQRLLHGLILERELVSGRDRDPSSLRFTG